MRLNRIAALSATVFIGLISIIGKGGGDAAPSNPDVFFSTFPAGYFTDEYREAYSFAGSDTAGGTYTGDISIQTGAQTTFNGTPAIPVSAIFNITNTQTSVFDTETVTIYFSTDLNDLRFLGSESVTLGIVSTAISTTAIPKTARIGDFGNVGTYTDSTGDTDVETWQITDGSNGRAFFVDFISTTDQFGNFDGTAEEKYLINENGDHLSLEFRFFDESSGVTVTLTGTKTL
jgi:hypothetical protein